MRTIGNTSARGLINLGEKRFAGLPVEQRAWLEKELGGPQFGVDSLRELDRRTDLTPTQRSIVVGLRQTLTGELRATSGRALTKEGAKELPQIRALTLAAARAPTGETSLQQKVR